MAHDSNTNGNHDARGRFMVGNKAGRGNPHHRRVAELRAKMLERVTPDDTAAVVEALVTKAQAGDTAATKLLFDRVFGRIADYDAAAAGERAELEAAEREIAQAERRRDLGYRAMLAGVDLPRQRFSRSPKPVEDRHFGWQQSKAHPNSRRTARRRGTTDGIAARAAGLLREDSRLGSSSWSIRQ